MNIANTIRVRKFASRTLAVFNEIVTSNDRLRQIFASDVTMVTGDCDAMKFGEKLYSVGFQASAFDDEFPGVRPMRCVPVAELPPGAVNGPSQIGLVRSPEEVAAGRPPAIAGPAVVVFN